jgi:uncharacterized protein DUF6932
MSGCSDCARRNLEEIRCRYHLSLKPAIFPSVCTPPHLARFIIFGSFITSKPDPNDVDVFLLLENTFEASRLGGEVQVLFDHSAAQAFLGASVFWLRRLAALEGEQKTIEYWQVKRGGGQRGIVEIIPEAP